MLIHKSLSIPRHTWQCNLLPNPNANTSSKQPILITDKSLTELCLTIIHIQLAQMLHHVFHVSIFFFSVSKAHNSSSLISGASPCFPATNPKPPKGVSVPCWQWLAVVGTTDEGTLPQAGWPQLLETGGSSFHSGESWQERCWAVLTAL